PAARPTARVPQPFNLATAWPLPRVLAVNRTGEKLPLRLHALPRMPFSHVRDIALIVRYSKHLQIRLAQAARTLEQPRAARCTRRACIAHPSRDRRLDHLAHAPAPFGSARYCVSTAVGCVCFHACMQILMA